MLHCIIFAKSAIQKCLLKVDTAQIVEINSFYSAGLLPDWKTLSLSDKIPDNINGFRRIKEWEFILDKLLVQEKYALHHCSKDSLAFEYSGKIVIYITNNVSAELINTSDVLKEVNTITLPYFDITYDEIDIKKYRGHYMIFHKVFSKNTHLGMT